MTYCILDSLVLLCFTVLVLCVVGFQALCWGIGRACGEMGHFLWLTKREYGKLLLYGMLLPAGLYWLWLHADLLSGRGVGYQANLTMFCIQSFVLVVGLPVWFRFYSRAYPAAPLPGAGSAGGGEAPHLPAVPDLCDDGDSALDRLPARGRRRTALRGQPGTPVQRRARPFVLRRIVLSGRGSRRSGSPDRPCDRPRQSRRTDPGTEITASAVRPFHGRNGRFFVL